MAAYANIIIDISHEKLDKSFQYRVPDALQGRLTPGMQVVVPFGQGNRRQKGFVIELTDEAEYDLGQMKEIEAIDEQGVPVEAGLIALAAWMKAQYGGTMSQALRTVLPVKQKKSQKEVRTLRLAVPKEEAEHYVRQFARKHNTARERLLAALCQEGSLPWEVVTGKLNVSPSVIHSLEEMGLLELESQQAFHNPKWGSIGAGERPCLNEEQRQAVDAICADFKAGVRGTYLLHGVTGSGKTEVYLALIEEVLREGMQAIMLIPEIALTYQTVIRFCQRFGDRVSILHSRMSAGERYDSFLRAKNGELDVIIGPRSALFLPFPKLGLIILDEEHETSYKSETVPRYHARETAIERARQQGASVVLGSATPSLESYERARRGEYRLLELNRRVEERPLPQCEIIDMRAELLRGNRSFLSGRLQELMEDRLSKGQQTMLFLNRRGVSGFVSCRACGYVFRCPHCDVSLSRHNNRKLICHYCGHAEDEPDACPKCGSKYVSGFKAGTEKIEEIVKGRFPNARVLRMDFDTTRQKEGYERILSTFANQEADILVGTQMIVKGHDFPNVTLVGILAADLSLHMSDYHGPERTFQLLTQAAGRAGRGSEPGHVVIQTYTPEHYSIQLAARQDYRGFFEQEMSYRKLMRYPPVWHMLVMLVASEDAAYGAACASLLGQKVQEAMDAGKITGLVVLGPTDAAVPKVKDIYKKVIYFKHEDYSMLVRVKDALEELIRRHKELQSATVQFDFDPMGDF